MVFKMPDEKADFLKSEAMSEEEMASWVVISFCEVTSGGSVARSAAAALSTAKILQQTGGSSDRKHTTAACARGSLLERAAEFPNFMLSSYQAWGLLSTL